MFAGSVYADNEIYIDQSGDNVNIDLEQLGSSNIIGGLDSTNGSMTKAILTGGTMTLDINQIGSSNKFLTGGLLGTSPLTSVDSSGNRVRNDDVYRSNIAKNIERNKRNFGNARFKEGFGFTGGR